MDDEITEFIIEELGKHRAENELIAAVARRANLSWHWAERLIRQVESDHQDILVRRKNPWLIAAGISTAVSGFGLMGASGWLLGAYFYGLFKSVQQRDLVKLADYVACLPGMPQGVYFLLSLFGTGLAMFIGAAWGLGPVILELWERRRSE
jgi:hypothetical protein